jgi:anti-sigma B factor antagonist
MWNPFSKQAELEAAAAAQAQAAMLNGDPGAGRRTVRHKIAELEHMRNTAIATLTVTELTQEKGVEMLSDLLEDLAESGAQHFVLDIQNVQFMDSACLGCLVEALNRLAKSGGKIALANTANSVQYLFRMTQLDRVFPICTDVMAALAAVERVPGQE